MKTSRIPARRAPTYLSAPQCPQSGRERAILPQPISLLARSSDVPEAELLKDMKTRGPAVLMMGQNPELPVMPANPALLDFFHFRLRDIAFQHLLQSAKLAQDQGQDEKVVLACLLHDISLGGLIRVDHGYWAAQMIAPYVSEEIAWAVKYHQALRYFPDESVGYRYPEAYVELFGADFRPADYLRRDYEEARRHRWYMTSRLITINDVYSFQEGWSIDPEQFSDLIGRHFRQPKEGLGFDNSPVAHMWRSMIWPDNAL